MSSQRGRGRMPPRNHPGTRPARFPARHHEDARASSTVQRRTGYAFPQRRSDSPAMAVDPNSNECFVCCREIEIYAVGTCDHPVCHICATRLRILCRTMDCSVCRSTLDIVYFVRETKPFADLNSLPFTLKDDKYAFVFENDHVKSKYDELLTIKCNECVRRALISERSGERACEPVVYPDFDALREHVQRDHKRYFCDLCVDNLNLFSFERIAYSRTDLKRHLKEGDLDDKSHKGHPQCEYCKTHYLDKDELYRHLKVDHFNCFLCQQVESEDRVMEFYETYEILKKHFAKEHFLCEQGECANQRFVAFRTEIDFKAHNAGAHSDLLTRDEQRATRTLGVDFQEPDRHLYGADGRNYRRGHRTDYSRSDRYGDRERFQQHRVHETLPEVYDPDQDDFKAPSVDTTSTKDFPTLLGEGESSGVSRPMVPVPKYGRRMATLHTAAEEFPSLGSPSSSQVSSEASWCPRKHPLMKSPVSATSRPTNPGKPSSSVQRPQQQQQRSSEELFPSLPRPSAESSFGRGLKLVPLKTKPAPVQKKSQPSWKNPVAESSLTITTQKTKKKQSTSTGTAHSDHQSKRPTAPEQPLETPKPMTINETLEDFDLAACGASWASSKDSKNKSSPKPKQNPNTGARPKKNDEEFPSLGPAEKKQTRPTGFPAVRPKYRGIKPGEALLESHTIGEYIKPPFFNKRTTELSGFLKLLLDSSSESISEYRIKQTDFRRGILSAPEFVEDCLELFSDREEFTKIFIEIIALTPDIQKQQELLICYDNLKELYGSTKKAGARDWIRCQTCDQILIPEDAQTHQKSH